MYWVRKCHRYFIVVVVLNGKKKEASKPLGGRRAFATEISCRFCATPHALARWKLGCVLIPPLFSSTVCLSFLVLSRVCRCYSRHGTLQTLFVSLFSVTRRQTHKEFLAFSSAHCFQLLVFFSFFNCQTNDTTHAHNCKHTTRKTTDHGQNVERPRIPCCSEMPR